MSPRRIHSLQMKKFLSLLLLVFAFSFLVGCRNYFLTYPYPWDYSKEKPRESDLVGSYKILKLRLSPDLSSKIVPGAQITLNSDGTGLFTDVPGLDVSGEKLICNLTSAAKWKLATRKENGAPWVLE